MGLPARPRRRDGAARRRARDGCRAFETFGFPGHAVTGREFVAAIAKATRRELQVKRMTWWLIHALRPFLPLCRELSEMAYLWQVPHRIDGEQARGRDRRRSAYAA